MSGRLCLIYIVKLHFGFIQHINQDVHCPPVVSLGAPFLPLETLHSMVTCWQCLHVPFEPPENVSDAEMLFLHILLAPGSLTISASMCPQTGEKQLESPPWLCMTNCNCYHLGILLQNNSLWWFNFRSNITVLENV